MKVKKISIVTVSFNAEKTIEETIKSVVNQTYSNIEFVIIDGASTDGTLDIIKQYRNKIDMVVSEPDKGIYDAMNKGIKRATGDWILFLGADDTLFDIDTISKCVPYLNSKKYSFIYGDVIKVPSQERYDGKFNLYKLIYKNICHQAIFFNQAIFDQLGLYNQVYKVNADWEFNMRVFQDPTIKTKYIPVVVSRFFEAGLSGHQHDEIYEVRRKEFFKTMPLWVKACYKYRRSRFVKQFSKQFLNFDYA
ncbi:glycosyltransferase family 2 protein [Mangrovimonas sp. TPBH4]|uniref:glycosyltransferase family 2 protein n=1 Tax=Mangrovimonas sp. TPBH4 TaxID=1645914 RepID=UPI0006B4285B|nr:glycosyltransferase family 2 protein [Mangrovimonas sp. TPBH4]